MMPDAKLGVIHERANVLDRRGVPHLAEDREDVPDQVPAFVLEERQERGIVPAAAAAAPEDALVTDFTTVPPHSRNRH